jgi:hypothetical protein
MAAAPKSLKFLGLANPSAQDLVSLQYAPPGRPLDQAALAQTVIQLQNTVNEIITRLNQLCTDTAHAGDQVTGAGTAATNLFTNN